MRTLLLLWLAFETVALAQPPAAPVQGTAPPAGAAPVVSEILAAQVMLDRVGFSPGEIDGQSGMNLRRALSAYQQSRGLPVSGRVDDATWMRLTEDSGPQPPLTTYTIADADVAGPFQPNIPRDLVEQSKLEALHYRDALELLAEKSHSSPRLLQTLNPGQTFTQAGAQIVMPDVTPVSTGTATPGGGRVTIAVTRNTSALTVEDAGGRVLFHAPVTSGSKHDPLPVGRWKVTGVQRSPVFHYNPDLFWDANPAHSKARIPPGPNNPVGVAWIDISKEHYGIHGAPEPSTVGHVQSHGCVRLTNWDVNRLLPWVRPGTVVVFR